MLQMGNSRIRSIITIAASLALSGCQADAQSTSLAPSSSARQPDPASSTKLVLPEETPLRVRIERSLNTRRSRTGEPLLFTLVDDVSLNGVVAIPRGATLHGEVEQAHKATALAGRPELILKLDSLELGGRVYPLYSYRFQLEGVSRGAPALGKIAAGAILGAQAGNVLGGPAFTTAGSTAERAEKTAEGAGAGAGAGTAVALLTAPPPLVIPAEAQLDFYLAAPLAVQPVSSEEAAQLRRKISSDEPKLYLRGEH